jgi:hypothetical protein
VSELHRDPTVQLVPEALPGHSPIRQPARFLNCLVGYSW